MKKYINLGLILICLILLIIAYNFNLQKGKQQLIMSKSVCNEVLKETNLEPVKMFEGKPAKVNFAKYPSLNLYRTMISKQVADGPNFAGHYAFVSWGCGTDCITYTIIDSITGNSLFSSVQVVQNMTPSINLNSRLLTFNSKNDLQEFKGLTLNEIKNKNMFILEQGREYYELVEGDDNRSFLNKLCTENVLDGVYVY